jgi:hypothetical protein
MRRSPFLALLLAACSADAEPSPESPKGTAAPVVVKVVEGEPGAGTNAVPTAQVSITGAAPVLGVAGGHVVVATDRGVYRASLTGDDKLQEMPLALSEGEVATVGKPVSVTPRGTEGFVLLTESSQLFHAQDQRIARSPLSTALEGKQVSIVDALGEGPSETLWLTTAQGVLVHRKGTLQPVSLPGADKAVAALGIDAEHGLLVGTQGLWEVDLGTGATASRGSAGVSGVRGAYRDDTGTLFLATDAGLLVRSATGELSRYTLAPAAAAPRAVRAVTAGVEGAYALVDDDLVGLAAGKTTVFARGVREALALALDANGDLWTATPSTLTRHRAGKPASFAVDVKPFMQAHCMSCHAGKGAPTRAFDQYDVAKTFAKEIALRLRAAGRPVMPPTSTEQLEPADYRAVLRWTQTGTPE